MFDDFETGCASITVILIVLVLGVGLIVNYASVQTVNGTITDTKIDNGNTYFVFQHDGTGQKEMLENNDNWLFGKFNSNDYLMNIQVGHHYAIKVNWLRFPLFSWFRNILDYQETPAP